MVWRRNEKRIVFNDELLFTIDQADFEKTGKAIALLQSMDGSEINFGVALKELTARNKTLKEKMKIKKF